MACLRYRNALLAALLAALGIAGAAHARDLFSASISIGGGPATTLSTNKARDIPDFIDDQTLLSIDPGYDAAQAVAATLDIRGLRGDLSFDALVNTLRFTVPAAGVDVSFDGPTRDEALSNFEDWLKGEFASALAPKDVTTSLLQGLVAESPVDPVAGNPNSLQSRMFDADFRMGTAGGLSALRDGGIVPSLFRLDIGGGYYDADGFDVYALDLPLHFGFGLGERVALMLDVPVTFTSTESAWSGMASGGLGMRVMPFSWWALTPAARVGGVGSLDVGALAVMYSGTLTSHIRVPVGPIAFGMGNMGGVAKTIDAIEIEGFAVDYDLSNWVTRNGLYVEGRLAADRLGTGFGWRVFASDARFFGDELFLESYQKVGAAAAAGLPVGGLQLELAYLTGRRYQGVSTRLGLRF
jgi:hypothetical protein